MCRISGNFAGNTSTHSLRKGGARFYSAAEAPEQATQQQGGWRTTETMRTIYTSLTPAEVQKAIHNAANVGGIEFTLSDFAQRLACVAESARSLEDHSCIQNLLTVSDAVDRIPWSAFIRQRAGIIVKSLVSHPSPAVRTKAISVLCMLRSKFAAYKAKNRK